MASKSGQESASTEQIEELLDAVDSTLDRLKTLYEQYFLGIQKQAPAYIHSDVERKLRELTQLNIRNTGLRYRLATLQQKFGSYNSYWRRTLRQIENGTYLRNLAKIGREAARTGSDVPEEILAAMPKRMREQVLRDRDQAIAMAKRRKQLEDEELLALADDETEKPVKTASGAHVIEDEDIDFNELFSAFEDDAPKLDAIKAQPIRKAPTRPPLPSMPVPESVRRTGATRPPATRSTSTTQPTRAASQGTSPTQATRGTGSTQAIPRAATHGTGSTQAIPRAATDGTGPSQAVPRAATERGVDPAQARPDEAQPSRISTLPGQRQTGPVPAIPSARATGPAPTVAGQRQTGPVPAVPTQRQTGPVPAVPTQRQTGPVPAVPTQRATGPVPSQRATGPMRAMTEPGTPPPIPNATGPQHPRAESSQPTQAMPRPPVARPPGAPPSGATQPLPRVPTAQPVPRPAPSQQSRPIPVMPGAAAQTGPVPVESMSGPFPRAPTERPQVPKPAARTTQAIPRAPLKPPPGMTEADVNALHAKYVKAKQMVGEKVDAGSREKLLKTLHQTAPKIMEQYKASAVDFSVVVKDNQVVLKAKPRT